MLVSQAMENLAHSGPNKEGNLFGSHDWNLQGRICFWQTPSQQLSHWVSFPFLCRLLGYWLYSKAGSPHSPKMAISKSQCYILPFSNPAKKEELVYLPQHSCRVLGLNLVQGRHSWPELISHVIRRWSHTPPQRQVWAAQEFLNGTGSGGRGERGTKKCEFQGNDFGRSANLTRGSTVEGSSSAWIGPGFSIMMNCAKGRNLNWLTLEYTYSILDLEAAFT